MCSMSRAAALVFLACLSAAPAATADETRSAIAIRGKTFTLYWSGPAGGEPVVVLSGDGGWVHLGPQAADLLARRGYRVAGFDSKAYLSQFTERGKTLTEADVPRDLKIVIDAVSRDGRKPILVGVSLGAGLAVLAASDAAVKASIRGILGLGLGDENELGWRFRDTIIYLTKGMPNEPTFKVTDHVHKLTPLPLAAIHSTRDEFVPMHEITQVMAVAREPKRLWTVTASDHRFSDNQKDFQARLAEALAWIVEAAPPPPPAPSPRQRRR